MCKEATAGCPGPVRKVCSHLTALLRTLRAGVCSYMTTWCSQWRHSRHLARDWQKSMCLWHHAAALHTYMSSIPKMAKYICLINSGSNLRWHLRKMSWAPPPIPSMLQQQSPKPVVGEFRSHDLQSHNLTRYQLRHDNMLKPLISSHWSRQNSAL